MQFTRAEEYGIMGVMYLADQEKDRVVPLSEIAEAQDVPEKFLAKIFQNLTKAGVVRSHRGVKGGFTLGRDPREISMRDVVETVQGPYQLIKCLHDRGCCGKYECCSIRPVIQEAENSLLEIFGKYNVAYLLKEMKAHKSS